MKDFGFFSCGKQRIDEDSERIVRDLDLAMLRALIDSERLRADELKSFADMLSRLLDAEHVPRFVTLTAKQRAWVKSRCGALEIDVEDPAERNRNVPRGAPVEQPAILRRENLPLRPPRKVSGA